MPDYSWPPMEKRKVMGKRLNRLDGIVIDRPRVAGSGDAREKLGFPMCSGVRADRNAAGVAA